MERNWTTIYKILRILRRKCNQCFWGLKTAPMLPRMAQGSSLSDAFIIEAIISKFYSLIPAERYAQMISQGIRSRLLLNADETTHKMLERTDVKSWYLWAFSTPGAYYFEIHDTRSSEVAIDFLKNTTQNSKNLAYNTIICVPGSHSFTNLQALCSVVSILY